MTIIGIKIETKRETVLLLVIFFLALFLRAYQLNDLPHGFYEEEVTNTYVGRFILLHGKDLYGNIFPLLYFDKFGDYPPVLPMYLSGIGTFLFGVNEFAGRFPIAFLGALTIFPLYFLSLLIFKEKNVSLFSALLLAMLPWHIVLSRTTAEGVIGFTAFSFGLLYVLRGITEKKNRLLFLSFIFFFLTYFLYPSLRILVPLALLPLPFLTAKHDKRIRIILALSVLFFFALTFSIASTEWGRGRFLQTSLFHSKEVAQRIQSKLEAQSFDEGKDNIMLARIFHNKIVGYIREFADLYFSYFSPKYLFLEGGGQYRYYNVPSQGLLYISFAPLFLFGLLSRIKNIHRGIFAYVLYLLVVSPIPSALTVDFVPHVHRSMFMIIPLVILATYGLYNIWDIKYKKLRVMYIFFLLLLLEFVYFWHQYSQHSASLQSVLRNDGDRELSLYLKEQRKNYAKVIMPGFERLPIYYLFFTNNFDPSLAGKFRREVRIDKIETIEFFGDWCPSKYIKANTLSPKTLVVDNGDCETRTGYKEIALIVRRDSTRAYRLLIPTT